MNKIFKYTKFYFIPLLMALVTVFAASGCSDDDDELEQAAYGYVQFKLTKSVDEAQTRAESGSKLADKLEKLNDAKKIKIVLQHNGATIEQTLVLNTFGDSNAEFGLRSDKLKLMAGSYQTVGYFLYDKLDEQIYASGAGLSNSFTVTGGGMTLANLAVEVVERGMVNFKVIKNFVKTRANGSEAYTFDRIKSINVTVKNLFTQELTTINKLKVKLTEDYTDGQWTMYGACDSIVWLKAGTYQVTSYSTYSTANQNNGTYLETATVPTSETFRVEDNKLTRDAQVPVRLEETADYIKDYLALKELWLALDGPNWEYVGEEQVPGCNWDFDNRDLDMWGYQPGVQLLENGRVAYISLAGFGPKGVVPDVIGQFTELRVLYLGTHSEQLGGKEFAANGNLYTGDEGQREVRRMDYYNRALKRDFRADMSDILVEAINDNPEMKHIEARIQPKDVQMGQLSNGITAISEALMRCTKLEQLYVANSPIKGGDAFFAPITEDSPYYEEKQNGELKWSNLTSLLDVEIYNCPQMDELPMVMLSNLPELQSLNIACNRGIPGRVLKNNWQTLATPREEGMDDSDYEWSSLNYNKIQLMYMGFNNLEETPRTWALQNMTKLGLLDLSSNKLHTIYPFTKAVNIVQFFLDNNQLTEIPHDSEGYFFGYNDLESFSCAGNKLTLVPDIFNARSVVTIGGIDLSRNQISGFENGDSYKGINTKTLSLAGNRFEEFPKVLFHSGSSIGSLNLSANGMKRFPKGTLEGGKYTYFLTSLDLTFNELTDLPIDFTTNAVPYLYGIDLSYNSFSKFPFEPFNSANLNLYGIRHQRDAQGNRTLREWPTGVYQAPSLVRLFLGSNDLRKVEDTISPRIRYLEIKDNPNISIDVTSVCPYITAGMYMLIYDKTQDIRGCDALGIE